jgi:SAM-dependent methyltransferase
MDFNEYSDSYRATVEDSFAIPGVEHDFFNRAKARHLLALADAHLGDPAELSVLDVGCGVGETDRMLEGRFGKVAGVDVAGQLLERAAAVNPGATYRAYAEGDPIPFDDETFDLTFAICVLHHVPTGDWERFVGDMARVTRPGGLVAIFEHNPWNPLTRRTVHNCEFDEDAVLLSRPKTRRLLAGQGLTPVESAYTTFFTRDSRGFQRAERLLRGVPAGAQYYAAARKSAAVNGASA